MRLYLAQHGEAVAPEQDADRPLSERGRADIENLSRFLHGRLQVSRVLHSGKTRARQTAEILRNAVPSETVLQAVDGINPRDDTGIFLQRLLQENSDTLVVGHLPFMADLVSRLLGAEQGGGLLRYTPGSLVALEPDDGGHWQIQWMVRPDLLGAGDGNGDS